MANKDFDCTALLQFIEGTVGKSLNDIATEFRVSIRTVQRRLREVRYKFSGLDIRECHDGGVKTYRCIRHGISVTMGIKKRDIITLHRLGIAQSVFRASGLIDHADAIEAHVEALMANMPRATRQTCERELQRLSRLDKIKVRNRRPEVKKGILDALHFATLARRNISVVLVDGTILKGSIEAVSYNLGDTALVSIRERDGSDYVFSLANAEKIIGVDDLLHDCLKTE